METSIQLELTPSCSILRLEGPLFASTAAQFLRASQEAARGPAVEIRCAGVESVGGAGLQILIALEAALRKEGKPLRLIDPSAALTAALELCNLTKTFLPGGQ